MSNFTVDKTKNEFFTKGIRDQITLLFKDPVFASLIKEPDKERFWDYIKGERNPLKAAVAVVFDGYESHGIFDGCTSLPLEFHGMEAVLTFDIPETFEGLDALELVGLTNLREITVPSSNPYFSSVDGVLYNKDQTRLVFCPLNRQKTDLVLPDTVTEIDKYAFSLNANLKRVVLPRSLKKMDDHTFDMCRSLESIEVHPDNPAFLSADGVLYKKRSGTLVKYPVSKKEKCFSTYNKTKYLRTHAFSGSMNLEEVTLNDGLKKIGRLAFSNCSNLRKVSIPDSVTHIDWSAFSGDINLTSVNIPPLVKSIPINVFDRCKSLADIVIPEGVEKIEQNAFRDCISLTKVELPKSIQTLDFHAFHKCKSLVRVIIPKGIKTIRGSAFAGCRALGYLEYEGTKDEWSKINITTWCNINYRNNINIIQCSDGVIYV